MRSRIFLFLSLFVLTLMVQTIYSTLNSDVNIVELVESNEDIKKIPIIKDSTKSTLTIHLAEQNDSQRFYAINENVHLDNVLEVVVPPPRA